jgi:beta-glucanase (GH16 family)
MSSPGTGPAARGVPPRVLATLALSVVLILATLLVLLDHGAAPKVASRPQTTPQLDPHLVRATAPAWKLKLNGNFQHGLDRRRWGVYFGESLGNPGGFFAPSHVSVVHGILTLDAYRDPQFGDRWVSGGVSSAAAVSQTYGKYLVRTRMGPGRGIIGAILLWPAQGPAPPEVNFAKDVGSGLLRNHFTASVIPTGGPPVTRSLDIDWSNWHTIGLEWTPRQLVFTVDGKAWASIRGRDVPALPMQMDIQSQAAACGADSVCPGASGRAHVRLQVAWVRIYAYRGRH